jgi:hypothetical protein
MVYRDLSLGSHRLVMPAGRKRGRSSTAPTSIAVATTVVEPSSEPTLVDGTVPLPTESPIPHVKAGRNVDHPRRLKVDTLLVYLGGDAGPANPARARAGRV